MAGGHRRGSDHGSMADRLEQTRRNQDGGSEPLPKPPEVKNCWYNGPYGRQPALLLKWDKPTPTTGWRGYIAVVAPEGDGWALVTQWVNAGMLEPVAR